MHDVQFLYIVYSFFATGNMASINSFDISAVRCFVNVFSPFTMTSLLIIKIIIPFVAVTSVFRAINIVSRVSTTIYYLFDIRPVFAGNSNLYITLYFFSLYLIS